MEKNSELELTYSEGLKKKEEIQKDLAEAEERVQKKSQKPYSEQEKIQIQNDNMKLQAEIEYLEKELEKINLGNKMTSTKIESD